ncbi:hypothetical protein [Halomonas borealis]|uniref:hypothetical protein n=1 Tax=Halomonas borealis TaxID=2508710 RepID=UPI0010A0160E|nr:hypothetical protein [Halomonas borealis]
MEANAPPEQSNSQAIETLKSLLDSQSEVIESLQRKILVLETKVESNGNLSSQYESLYNSTFDTFNNALTIVTLLVAAASFLGVFGLWWHRRSDINDLVAKTKKEIKTQSDSHKIIGEAVNETLYTDDYYQPLHNKIKEEIIEHVDVRVERAVESAAFKHTDSSVSRFRNSIVQQDKTDATSPEGEK